MPLAFREPGLTMGLTRSCMAILRVTLETHYISEVDKAAAYVSQVDMETHEAHVTPCPWPFYHNTIIFREPIYFSDILT